MNRKYLVASALLIWAAAPLSAQSVKAGIDAWQRADYPGAVTIWRPLAEKGDADAQFNLGQAYRLGRGVETNLAAAKTWFERAANQGHIDAETTLGLLLFQNGNQAEGLTWLKKAAVQGEPRAQLMYGTALVNGDGVTQDPILGYAYIHRAAAQGLGPAKDTLAQLDQMLPIADRKRGADIAGQIAKAEATAGPAPQQPVSKPVQAVTKARPASKAAPKSVVAKTQPSAPEPAPKKIAAKEASAKPSPKPAPAATPVSANGHWRIQLGAFSKKGSAESLYKKVSGKDALAGRKPFYVAAGAVTRLQIGPFESRSAAESACRAVGSACFPVEAK